MYTTPYNKALEAQKSVFCRNLLCSSALVGALMTMATTAVAEETTAVIGAQTAGVAAAAAAADDNASIDEILVVGKKTTYGNNITDKIMMDQESSASSVLAVLDNIPGIFVSEGGTFGSDDWSTTLSVRGFNVGLSEQQIGMTIDGLPNGNSNYGGGSKANRYIDSENLSRAEVSQGTSDISSASHEALGGTINFITNDPLDDARLRAGISIGDNNARRLYFRYDTGNITDNTKAYLSYSRQSNDAWIGNAGLSDRNHFAAKFVTKLEDWTITGRISWDEAQEDNFQRISTDQFNENPDWDRLTDTITGIPYVDQAYRPSWSTLRTNYFAYLRAAYQGDKISATITPYFHNQKGRGDWVPQYIVQTAGGTTTLPSGVRDLHTGPDTVYGGSFIGTYSYADAAGTPLTPNAGCTARLTFPYGGGGASDNPACYDGDANPAGSYRHTHYNKQRIGLTGDATYDLSDNNTLRAGFWWERADRDEGRDWHRIIDPRVSHQFDEAAYWRQYDRNFLTNTFMVYAEDKMEVGDLVLNGGVRKFFVDLTRKDNFGIQDVFKKSSNSKVLFTAGALYNASEEVELFTGFSQNFAAIKDNIIEGTASSAASTTNASILAAIDAIKGETADNFDVGIRFRNDRIRASLTAYYINFNNRITGIAAGDAVTGVDYLEEGDEIFLNVGGIKSKGIEASVSMDVADNWNVYSALTLNDSVYSTTVSNITKDNKVALAPEFQFVTTVSFQKDGVFSGLSGKHVGKRWGDFDNTDRLAAYTVFDFWIGYEFEMNTVGLSNMKVSLNVNNLTDKRYLGGGTPGGYFIGTGRQAMANVTFDF